MQDTCQEILRELRNIVEEQNRSSTGRKGSMTLVVRLSADPDAANHQDPAVSARMRLCTVQVYLDVGMLGQTTDQVRVTSPVHVT